MRTDADEERIAESEARLQRGRERLERALVAGRQEIRDAFRIPDHIRDLMENPDVYPDDPADSPYRRKRKQYQTKLESRISTRVLRAATTIVRSLWGRR